MSRIRVRTTVGAAPDAVWAELADIPSHVEWMADAEAITFTTASRTGTGTAFDCVTKVGPFRLNDRMEVVEWEPSISLGVSHRGIVTGTGRFTISPDGSGRTDLLWDEQLAFPWWMGGPIGGLVGGWVLARIWRGNLRRLRSRIESGRPA